MGATYTRQSSYTDGDVITAADTNNEFDQLLAAFAASTGHTHDGTANEGGPITKLLGTSITIGDATSGTDITVTFDGESNDGVFKWMEDEDYFEFSDDILVATTEKIQFRDTAIYINSSADGQLDIVADTEIQIAATTVDINGNVDVSGTLTVAGAVDFGDAALSNVGAVQLDSIAGDGDTDTSITFSGSNVITVANGGTGQVTFNDGSISPVTDSDVDLGTTSLRFKDVYIDSATVTGEVAAASLDISGNIDVDGTTNLDVVDIDGAVDMATTLAVAGNVDFNGDLDVDGTTNLDVVDIDGAVNIAADTTIASTNKIIFNDASQFIHAPSATGLDLAATDEIELTATLVDVVGNFTNSGTIVSTGKITADAGIDIDNFNIDGTTIALSSGSMTIDAASNITLDADGGTITFADAGSSLGTITSSGYSGTAAVATTAVVTDSTANTSFPVVFNNESNGLLDDTSAFVYNPSSGTLSVANLVISGDTTTNSSTNLTIADPLVKYGQGSTGTSVDQGFIVTRGDGSSSNTANRGFIWDESADEFATIAANTEAGTTAGNVTINDYAPLHVGAITADDASTFSGEIAAASLDISGNIDVDGTSNLDIVDIDGAVDMATTLSVTGNVTLGAQLIMPDVTSTKILVADGTSYQEVAVSGDVTIANTGAVTIAANAVEGSMLNNNTISGQTALTSGLATDDELLVSDGGTLKRMDISVLTTLTDDNATALAIALG